MSKYKLRKKTRHLFTEGFRVCEREAIHFFLLECGHEAMIRGDGAFKHKKCRCYLCGEEYANEKIVQFGWNGSQIHVNTELDF